MQTSPPIRWSKDQETLTMKTILLLASVAVVFSLSFQSACAQNPPTSTTPPVAGQSWTNSLGVKFVPAGTDGVLFSIWDVRVKDFQAYAQATGYQQTGGIYVMKVKKNDKGGYSPSWELDANASWEQPGFEQGPTHPVVGVSWDEAKAFCQWLTDKERKEGTLGANQSYRLPTDAEWSKAVGDGKYPWGDVWPPPEGVGNYGDQALASSLPGTGWNSVMLPGNDGYSRTSPVGSFRANAYGLYDMGGNVFQWCEDWYQASMNSDELRKKYPVTNDDGGGSKYRVLRGASWVSSDPVSLLSSSRFKHGGPGRRNDLYGFRVVVVVSP
jgi:formylglycine-generating enzyme required for sulfatase activity